ncbi:hypothetical protein JCM17960_32270 [Magnetospira thiophila]
MPVLRPTTRRARAFAAFAPPSDYDWDWRETVPETVAERVLSRPIETWTSSDMARVMGSDCYGNRFHRLHRRAQEAVSDWFKYAFPEDPALADLPRTQWSAHSFLHAEDRRAVDAQLAARAAARALAGLGRHGDTILAHLTPEEARFLDRVTDGGSINPATGLLEFWQEGDALNDDTEQKQGKYIWHTAGDSKVRPAHAERDGKEFSWDDPPEGGHPGEELNCRCWAEEPNCTKEWLDLREIVKELVGLDAELSELKRKIHNKKLDIEIDEADIEFYEAVNTAAKYGSLLKMVPHPAGRFAGWVFTFGETISSSILIEINASLVNNMAELDSLESGHPELERMVIKLMDREKNAIQLYNKCKGII